MAAIAVPRLGSFNDRAEDAAAEATARTLNSAVAIFLATDGNELADLGNTVATAIQALDGAGLIDSNTITQTTVTFTAATGTFEPVLN